MKKVILFAALIACLFNLKASAQRSRNEETPVHLTKAFQQQEELMEQSGVAKWLAWGNGDIFDEQRMVKRQDTAVKVMTTKEFAHGVLPTDTGVVMLKADAFNLAYMTSGNFYYPDKVLSKDKPNLFLFRHGFYVAVYDDVKEAYYFYYYPHPLTKNDPIIKKGYKVFWINWSAITKEVKPVNLAEIENQKHAVILSKEESIKYLHVLDSINALHVTNHFVFSGGYESHINIDKKADYPDGKVLSKLEFWIRPEEGRNIGAPTEDVTFSYDHKTGKGQILWLTNHGPIRYHSEAETRERMNKLISSVDKFI